MAGINQHAGPKSCDESINIEKHFNEFIEELRQLKALADKVKFHEKEYLRVNSILTVPQKCWLYGVQDCHICEDFDCGDNLNPKKPKEVPAEPGAELNWCLDYIKNAQENDAEAFFEIFTVTLEGLFNCNPDSLACDLCGIRDPELVAEFLMQVLSRTILNGFSRERHQNDKVMVENNNLKTAIVSANKILSEAGIPKRANDGSYSLAERVELLWKKATEK